MTLVESSPNFLSQLVKKELNYKEPVECDPDLPLMSIGHGELTRENIEE